MQNTRKKMSDYRDLLARASDLRDTSQDLLAREEDLIQNFTPISIIKRPSWMTPDFNPQIADEKFTPFSVVKQREPFVEAIKNLDANLEGESFPNGYSFRGNLNTYIPIDESSGVGLGVSGMANKYGDYQDIRPTGVNASYTKGANTFEVEFNKLSPQQKKEFYLKYIYNF